MHQIILIAAMSTTTGLFGGGKHCGKGHHRKAVAASCYSASPCGGTSYASPYAAPVASMQSHPAMPQAAPLPTAVPTAPAVPAPAPAPPAPPAPAPSAAYPAPTGRPFSNLSPIGG